MRRVFVGAIAAVLLGVAIHWCPWEEWGSALYPNFLEAASMAGTVDKAAFKAATACVVGGSGEVGKELVRQLLQYGVFGKLRLVGRRQLDFANDPLYANVEQKVVNFEELGTEPFAGCDVLFCSLGTTRGKAGADGFYKVDHDYVMAAATKGKEAGVRHFSLVSSQGANKDSYFLYPKTKGEVEAEIGDLGFPRFAIFRPALLLCDRAEPRPGERLIRGLARPFVALFPTVGSIPTTYCAQAMIHDLWAEQSNPKGDIYTNAQCHQAAAAFREAFNVPK